MTLIDETLPKTLAPWTREQVLALLDLPFMDLVRRAAEVHARYWPQGDIELASLLSIKTGGCPEDCGYCPQSSRHDTGVAAAKMLDVDEVLAKARAAKAAGATRFCMGAAWRSPKDRDVEKVAALVREVHALGLETCATLGMLEPEQARTLREAGLDYYNHNLDTAPEFYGEVIGTRVYEDRLQTLRHVREAGLKVCCGGIVGMGETRAHRAGLIAELAALDPAPDSVPINSLVRVPGTPLADAPPVDPFELVRVVAAARIVMPHSRVRLSAGRRELGDGIQALCFLAGANSIFYCDQLLVTGNADAEDDRRLLSRLNLSPTKKEVSA
ncbi:biotin synthase BioB [Rubrivivax benzoatilyticus]|uniref:Biotin synthase n=1 Tax=Rubrivivax benzoatilyticus TaxID=316997 RepID=A0ABX0HQI9_9BURK|nr:biotin synthase BioB [Rubrivivax benzoatilyticus]EGJ09341.1 biotin synthase [Rubrivivax benzoatilyticus JA2 = ATCC BAA-35]NHK97341.1 biotin synthase BioB [Rubrivivax benzoatilyticus]NHL22964.1 biotin synthase BioB [Rubrivivax benzoatilyticus]